MNKFLEDVLNGLQSTPKYLDSKYFYDAKGDVLFQQIMDSPEYYPTRCEMEIFTTQTNELAKTLKNGYKEFDLVELGAGDATKSSHLLKALLLQGADFTYLPIDISDHVIKDLEENLPEQLPGLKVKGLNGEYFEMLKMASNLTDKPKVVLFLGGNIGNFTPKAAQKFCKQMRNVLNKGDMILMGIDLQKNPKVILDAYNDKAGVTREFNLNLLRRINRELDADFEVNQFEHYPVYDPDSGACKSYLISLKDQKVRIGEVDFIDFKKDEFIYTEISQKYTIEQVNQLAEASGFSCVQNYTDEKKWFLDAVWMAS